jgi:hypothetical protein
MKAKNWQTKKDELNLIGKDAKNGEIVKQNQLKK